MNTNITLKLRLPVINPWIVTALTSGFLFSHADAAMNLLITDAGNGQSRWQFSGSTQIDSGVPNGLNGFWFPVPFTSSTGTVSQYYGLSYTPVSGTWTGSSTLGGTIGLSDVFFDNQFGSYVGIRTSPVPQFGVGDTITWDGDFILDLPFLSTSSSYSTSVFGRGESLQSLGEPITIDGAVVLPVPEPTGTGLAAICGILFMLRRKRTV